MNGLLITPSGKIEIIKNKKHVVFLMLLDWRKHYKVMPVEDAEDFEQSVIDELIAIDAKVAGLPTLYAAFKAVENLETNSISKFNAWSQTQTSARMMIDALIKKFDWSEEI